jgi:hypothetical protein
VVFQSANPINQLNFTFTSDEIQVTDAVERPANPLGLRVTRFGSLGHTAALATATPVASGNRVEYSRQGPAGLPLIEWYVNGPLGLEQGFTVARAPSDDRDRHDGESTLVFETTVTGGWTPILAADASEVLITDGRLGQLHYGHLSASDAGGRLLPSSIAVNGQHIELRVDARGAEYPLTVDPLLQQILTASDRAKGDLFGFDVAISGDTALVGAPDDDVNGVDQGSAYVFVRSGTTWIQQAKLTANDGAAGDAFGNAVSISGNTAVIGAPNRVDASGAAYVFVRSGATWTQQAMLLEDPDKYYAFTGFGYAVDVDGDTILVGLYAYDPGVYVFVRTGSTWTKQARLPTTTNRGGVAIQGNTAVVGNGQDKSFKYHAYVFVRSGSVWTEQAKLYPKDQAIVNGSVDISGETVVLGTSGYSAALPGGASVFVRSGTAWAEQAKLTPTDPLTVADLGAVVLEGDTAVLSATFKNPDFVGVNQGAAYVFTRKAGAWSQQSKLTVKNITPNRDYGYALSFSGGTVMLGSADYESQIGAVFAFLVDVNAPPTISPLSAKTTPINTPIAVNFTVADAEDGPSGVTVSASSSNTTLVPNAKLVLSGTGASRTLTITPALNLSGTLLITITASDGAGSTNAAFTLRVGPRTSAVDVDGDGKTDINVFRPSNGTWYVRNSALAYSTSDAYQWGLPGDIAMSGDFDGDGRTELTVYRPSNGTWYLRYSASGYSATGTFQWGLPGDVPIAGDFDGDGRTDLTVWRPSNGTWYIRYSSLGYGLGGFGQFQWGLSGDLPLKTDFDGDGRTDLAVWRPSNGTWYVLLSSSGYALSTYQQAQWGLPGDIPMDGDFDGDGKTELTVWRPSNGTWYIRYSSLGYGLGTVAQYQWGLSGDIPITTDFDDDGKADLAVWRPSNGTWYIRYSSLGYGLGTYGQFQWGLPGDALVK